MANFEELDRVVSLADQMKAEDGPIVLINVFTVDAGDEEALVAAWSHDADFMKAQPGYISTQMHQGIAGSTTFINYAIWQDVESFRNAFTNPEFQRRIADYPPSAVAKPHLFRKIGVANHCVA
ncbi:MAG: antibiotic biosynthesis monooxygenase family protein [Roseibium album]|uniref:Antibiotic biosynthesis monooxygenase n=1 Tax=Roseibium album TaxID=311410 RepID=A0A0M7APN7_9HYPH|nr:MULTISPECIES: antibiotic biosynthesis monooxygenase family protein [Stappiaceae]MBG6144907.1 heme-degrading monooxygenase HmoA [Labrenzia sp. EL_142]MBG6163511.1 heme-degrading monooxygenase HmoA [Labrenzia sp. EL_195]MBG6173044.1 heme-degrading monooxygenase HmoA [Labrenzia sp. EL_132]MBG6203238.1 heme-degrading monooxygenase HmoA [Labrenzia sp. EL_13]MBG6228186.1 heme-degrading monooxygenase HmoA [Labrenzia sp. EL_208]MCR9057371.1 antibiotic biosynthesis monooxygenase [Paracoccaceae bact